jgi:hypothetical protein
MEFYLAHKKYIFAESVVLSYKWLSNMFGLYDIGEKKLKLIYNLKDYLVGVEMYIIREMIEALDYLECYYNNELKKVSYKNNFVIRMTENFLSLGPGETKGLDVEFVCNKCNMRELRPCKKRGVMQKKEKFHIFERINQNSVVCKNCGIIFSSMIDLDTQTVRGCIDNNTNNICVHDWM